MDLRRLVHVEPEAVARLVHDEIGEGRGPENAGHGRIQVVRRDARPGHAPAERVRLSHGLVDRRVALAHVLAEEGARDVRAEPVDLRPKIDQQRIARLERRVIGRAVRVRRVGARQHDGIEAERRRTMREHPGLQQRGDGLLAVAGANLVQGFGQRQLADLDGAREARDLVLVLGDAERLQGRVGVPHVAVA